MAVLYHKINWWQPRLHECSVRAFSRSEHTWTRHEWSKDLAVDLKYRDFYLVLAFKLTNLRAWICPDDTLLPLTHFIKHLESDKLLYLSFVVFSSMTVHVTQSIQSIFFKTFSYTFRIISSVITAFIWLHTLKSDCIDEQTEEGWNATRFTSQATHITAGIWSSTHHYSVFF